MRKFWHMCILVESCHRILWHAKFMDLLNIYHSKQYRPHHANSLTIKKQATKFSSANLKKNVKSKLYHIENSKS